MPVDPTALLKGLKPILKALDADLLKRAKDPGVDLGLKAAWQREKDANRTGAAFTVWRRRRTTQVAIAWVLSVIFVRTLEDRGFLARRRIVGDGAEDSERLFIALAPFLTPRDYLLTVFGELASLPGAGALFDARHNPVWVLAPSADVARKLLDFFRQPLRGDTAPPQFDGTDTRFLGDLYQNLSEDVRKRYALLQTPEFVEEFILDQTLDPAIETFGLAETNLIDPTCGSGHFLLGGFHRLFDAWQAEAPGEDRQVLAQRALSQVYGCDLNPFAVAIARFRLTLEFLQVAGIAKLARAPKLPLNLCVADSLLHGVVNQQMGLGSMVQGDAKKAWGEQLFALEDEEEALRILGKRYQAVVGNPPYITEKDPKKRAQYKNLYESAAGLYALAAPFTERFFGLAAPAAFVGLINANSFTKRDFGRKLIEEVLPRFDVARLIDTSGAYIPGHGTPTLLLFGRNRAASPRDVIAVLGKRGEAEEPTDPANAPVWSEIVRHHAEVGFDGRHVSVEPIPREQMAEHPWVLAGGGAIELKQTIESAAASVLDTHAEAVGFMCMTKKDEVFAQPPRVLDYHKVPIAHRRPFSVGEDVRDWSIGHSRDVVFPYDGTVSVRPLALMREVHKTLHRHRAELESRKVFGGRTYRLAGKPWWSYGQIPPDRPGRDVLVFPFVATHGHFAFDRGRSIFNQHAHIIKLQDHYDEDDHLALLGLLNSSVACFWMKMMFFDKGNGGYGGGRAAEAWERFYEFDGTKLKKFPVVRVGRERTIGFTRRLIELIEAAEQTTPANSLPEYLDGAESVTQEGLAAVQNSTRQQYGRLFRRIRAIQEELDWQAYVAYGLVSSSVAQLADSPDDDELELPDGARPAELLLAQGVERGLEHTRYFERHDRPQRTAPPQSMSATQKARVEHRLGAIAQNRSLKKLEQVEYKRRWPPRDWDAEVNAALRDWLLDHLETLLQQLDQPTAVSARHLASELQRDPKAQAVAEVYTGDSAPDLERLVTDLVKAEGMPFLAAYRYAETGLEKHAEWKKVWDLQRREDAGEDVGDIPVPPKYATKDYRRGSYWSHRGKLDVPKERFVLYPGAETDNDSSPWLGWAGWDHLQRATALSGLYQARKTEEGWEGDHLLPLLAGLHELVPWLQQWHNEPSADFGGLRLGDYFRDFVSGEAHALGVAIADLDAWRP